MRAEQGAARAVLLARRLSMIKRRQARLGCWCVKHNAVVAGASERDRLAMCCVASMSKTNALLLVRVHATEAMHS